MESASQANTLYFLGVEGEQEGPFTEAQVIAKITAKEVPPDALIWWEGISAWQPVRETSPFNESFKSVTDLTRPTEAPPQTPTSLSTALKPEPEQSSEEDEAEPEEPSVVSEPPASKASGDGAMVRKALKDDPGSHPPTFNRSGQELRLAFPSMVTEGASMEFIGTRVIFIALGVFFSALIAGGVFFWYSTQYSENNTRKPKIRRDENEAQRNVDLAKALSELSIKTDASIATLTKIIKDNPKDNAAKEALNALTDYYRQTQRFGEAGRIMMEVGRPGDAAKFFLEDGAHSGEAEEALYKAFQTEKDPETRAKYLSQDIGLLLQPINNVSKATERIQLFEKTFPGRPHAYSYYLKSTDERIQSIFNRISHFFVTSLIKYLESEFPQVRLVKRPTIEVRRNTLGEYRIVGIYEGDVLLNKDRLKKIGFVFWMADEFWVLADTNLTKERENFAKLQRAKYLKSVMTGQQMLNFLEIKFRSNFPKMALHETPTIAPPEKRPKVGPDN